MKKVLVIMALVAGVSAWSLAYAVDEYGPHQRADKPSGQDTLSQLPVEKEVLFRRTMREAMENAAGMRDEIVKARTAVRDVLVAPEFNESLFKERTRQVQDLLEKQHQVMGDAIVKLAKQYTPEERKLLAELITAPDHHGRGRWAPHRPIL